MKKRSNFWFIIIIGLTIISVITIFIINLFDIGNLYLGSILILMGIMLYSVLKDYWRLKASNKWLEKSIKDLNSES